MGCTLILGFGSLRPGSRDADQSGHPHGVLGVGTQATDWCASPPGGFGPVCLGHRASHLGVHQPVLQVCAGAAYPAFTVQGLMGWGCKRTQLLWRILSTATEFLYFLFFFLRNSSYSSPLVQTSTWPLTQPSLSLSQESCSPRDLIVLKHSSYRLIFQCPLQSLVSDLHICWNTVGCSLCSSDQLGVSLVPRGSGLHSHLSHCHLPKKNE